MVLLSSLLATTAQAQDAGSTANKLGDVSATNEIVVNAERPRGAAVTDVPAEVSLNSAVIAAFDAVDLAEVFQNLAPEISDGSGLAPIVLVNGQRIASFSSIRSIPPDAVSKIEIFPEEVALQYGYSPGQKVVNVVLRGSYHNLLLLARETFATENFRWIYEGKADFMRINANSHWNLDIDFQHTGPLYSTSTIAGPPPTGSTAPATTADVPPFTVQPQRDDLTITGSFNRNYGQLNAEFAGRLELTTVQTRLGLAEQDGALLASQGLSGLITGPVGRIDNTVDAQTSVTLNGRLDGWRVSFIGLLDATTRQTRTSDTLLAGGIETILLPSPTALASGCGAQAANGCVSTDTQRLTGDLFANGNLFALPAGQATAALRASFGFTDLQAVSAIGPGDQSRNRDEAAVQAHLDFPIASRDSWLGKLSAGLNGEVHQLSDFGTLSTLGTSAQWAPTRRIELLGSFSHQQQAPDLLQLGTAQLATPDVREFDFTDGNTAIVQRTTGGNGALTPTTANIARFRLQVSPFPTGDLTLSSEYTLQRARNPIVALTAVTAAAEEAFPDRYVRTDDGYLTAMDTSPVNIASRDQQQLRSGINWTTGFGSNWLSVADPGAGPKRDQFQIAFYHTLRLQDRVVLQQGQPALDLLDHDIISDQGGTSRHQIELQTTLALRQISFDFNANWQSPTTASPDGPDPSYRLTFSNGFTLNVKLQIRLAELHWLTRIFPHIKGTLRLSADNVLNAHLSVHDATGAVPPSYSAAYVNPTGPTFRLTIRKNFR